MQPAGRTLGNSRPTTGRRSAPTRRRQPANHVRTGSMAVTDAVLTTPTPCRSARGRSATRVHLADWRSPMFHPDLTWALAREHRNDLLHAADRSRQRRALPVDRSPRRRHDRTVRRAVVSTCHAALRLLTGTRRTDTVMQTQTAPRSLADAELT